MASKSIRRCRHDAYQIMVAQLSGGGDYSVDVCEEAALYRVRLARGDGEGMHIDVAVLVCAAHELELAESHEWIASSKVRLDPPALS